MPKREPAVECTIPFDSPDVPLLKITNESSITLTLAQDTHSQGDSEASLYK